MNRLDYCIKMQFKITAADSVVSFMMAVLVVTLFLKMGFGGDNYGGMWLAGVPCLVLGLGVSSHALGKIFVRSVYGSSGSLYQSLPVTASQQVTSKIFAAGLIFLLNLCPAALIFANGLGSLYLGRYLPIAAMIQLLVNRGYLHVQAPLFMALTVIGVILGCFAAAAAVQLAIAVCNRNSRDGGKRSIGKVILDSAVSAVAAAAVAAVNFLPYWFLLHPESGWSLTQPWMVPGAEILLNGVVLLAAGSGSVRMAER